MIYIIIANHLPNNLLLNPTKEGGKVVVEVDFGPRNSSLIRLVTTKYDFVRKEGTRIITDHNYAINRRGGGSMGAKGKVIFTMPEVVVGFKVMVGDEMFMEDIVKNWGEKIAVSYHGKWCMHFVKIQCSLTH